MGFHGGSCGGLCNGILWWVLRWFMQVYAMGMFGVKADLSKAYDGVNWKFLIAILSQPGFHPKLSTGLRNA